MEAREKFLRVFQQEHQVIFDQLVELRTAVREGDSVRAHEMVESLDRVMGPHIRVEEEDLYPMLAAYLGEQNVSGLIAEHDGAAAAIHELKGNAGDPEWLRENGPAVLKDLEGFFMHVTACDGLSIIVERFSDEQKLELADAVDRVLTEGLPLTAWRPAPAEAN